MNRKNINRRNFLKIGYSIIQKNKTHNMKMNDNDNDNKLSTYSRPEIKKIDKITPIKFKF